MKADLPPSMTAIAIATHGGPETLVAQTRPMPVPGEAEILVKVVAAGVNRPDILQRQGAYAPPPGASDIPGLEIAGEIVAMGPRASLFRLGQQVCALVPGGGYAEYCRVHETNALPIPSGMAAAEAAAIPETFFTVWTNVFERGRLQAGETLLVHGGSSGIGTTAIMLAKAFGARVIATAGSAEKCAACQELGADFALNYRDMDWVEGTKAATGGRGANLILDMVGGAYVAKNYAAAAESGRIVQIAFLEGALVSLDLRPLMLKRLTHTGSTLRPRTIAEKAAIAAALESKVWPLLAAGRCRPVIDSRFALREAAAAHRRMESSAHIGKILLTVESRGGPPPTA
jgi:NADPH2:quinone reductase